VLPRCRHPACHIFSARPQRIASHRMVSRCPAWHACWGVVAAGARRYRIDRWQHLCCIDPTDPATWRTETDGNGRLRWHSPRSDRQGLNPSVGRSGDDPLKFHAANDQ